MTFPSPGDLTDPGIKPEFPVSHALQAVSLPAEPSRKLILDESDFFPFFFGKTLCFITLPNLTTEHMSQINILIYICVLILILGEYRYTQT